MSWFVYIIRSKPNGTLYTGIAIDPDRRLRKHNGIAKGGAKATRAGRPWGLVFIEGPMEKGEALSREAEIKKLRRRDKLKLVEVYLDRVGECSHSIIINLVCRHCNWAFTEPESEPSEVTLAVRKAKGLLGD